MPQYLFTLLLLSPCQKPVGASRVLPCFSSCMPRPVDSGGPSHPRLIGRLVLPSGTLKPSASASHSSRSCTSTSGCASPLRPPGCSVYASPVLFAASRRLLHRRKTQYGWVASPYPTGTFTPQEAPSFLGAITTKLSRARQGRWIRPWRSPGVGWSAWLGATRDRAGMFPAQPSRVPPRARPVR